MSIFGQNPADITGAIFKSKNFSDVPDKAAARNNLGVPSKAEVLYNSVPIGMILPYWGNVAPAGYLPCAGQTVTSGTFPELVTFLGGGASQVVPDLRGEFLRGWDDGRGVDSGRVIKTSQSDETKSHYHYSPITEEGGAALAVAVGKVSDLGWVGIDLGGMSPAASEAAENVFKTSTVGGVETRPRNVSVLYCIKAYSSVQNYTSNINIAGLASDYSTLSAAAVKYPDFTGSNQVLSTNGYQKLPGGLIMQWGLTATGTTVVVTFPIAFPTAFLSIAAVANHSTGGADALEVSSISTTQFSATHQSSGSNSTGSSRWIAFGY